MNQTSLINLITENALGIALIIVFIFLIYKFLGWYDKNKKKIYKFRNKYLKGGKNKNGMENKKE